MGNIRKKKFGWLYDKYFNFSNYHIFYNYDFLQKSKFTIFSGSDDFEYAQKAIKINVIEYVLKPINSNELIEILKKLKSLIYNINKQYIDFFKGKKSEFKIWQLIIFIISQVFVVFAIVRRLFEEVYKYVSDNYIVAVKISTYLIIFIILYFIVGYISYSSKKIYKYLYKIEDKNTKTDLLISYFIISTYMTILVLFPEKFGEIYKIGLVGAGISYILNLKVLIRVIRSPEIIEVEIENGSKIKFTDVSIVAIILLIMVIFSLYLGVCFINSGDIGVYTNNPTYYDLFYYTIITFSTIGYGDICPISPVAKFMSMVISLTSFICLTIFVSSILSYKSEQWL